MPCKPEREDGYCDECKQPCKGVVIDVGIGAYEYWGSRETDTRWVNVSDCCEAEVLPMSHPRPRDDDAGDDDERLHLAADKYIVSFQGK